MIVPELVGLNLQTIWWFSYMFD